MKLRKIYYLSGTHWDREWYKTFQGFRYLLMGVLDDVIETLENDPQFPVYMLDGQTAVLDDYCEISPEKRARLEALIRDGRILVGPWYTMPDEFIPSGESLVENLLLGHETAREYGAEAMKYGYICDIFGHTAQMPQILSGFGIHGALMQRGCNRRTCPPQFLWRSPDKTECYATRTPEDFGYGAFYHYATEPYIQGWDKDFEALVARSVKEIDRELEEANVPYLVLHDALDHQRINKAAPKLAQRLSEHYGCPVVFTNLTDLVSELQKEKASLPVKEGELCETAEINEGTNILLSYIVSSRYDLKKDNDETQTLLEKWVQPLAAEASVCGRAIRPGYRKVAYRELMRNHAHDSICGCAVEEVHRDMKYRFRQTKMIGEEIVEDCFAQAAAKTEGGERSVLRILNPLLYPRTETIRVKVRFPDNFPVWYSEGEREYEQKPSFRLIDSEKREIPYTLCEIKRRRISKTPTQYVCDYATVCFSATLLPFGFTEFEIVPSEKTKRVRYLGSGRTGTLTAENKFLRLSVQENGTLTLCDKRTGRVFSDLLSYEDNGEIGDGWMHIRPAADSVFFSCARADAISLLYDGPAETAFCVEQTVRIPQKMEYDGGTIRRGEERSELKLRTILRLGSENPYVDIYTEIDNTAMDHRLRLLLPTDLSGDTYEAGQAFAFTERPCGGELSTQDWKEPQVGDRNFSGIAVKRAENGEGLAFLSEYGLHEIRVGDDARHTMEVTLFRSFAKTVGTNDYDQMDGELLGKLSFSYRLMPVTPETTPAELVRSWDALRTGVREYTAFLNRGAEKQPSFLSLSGDLAVSVVKVPEDLSEKTVIVRAVNYTGEKKEGTLTFSLPVRRADYADLLEEAEKPCKVQENRVDFSAAPYQIVTLRVTLEK